MRIKYDEKMGVCGNGRHQGDVKSLSRAYFLGGDYVNYNINWRY